MGPRLRGDDTVERCAKNDLFNNAPHKGRGVLNKICEKCATMMKKLIYLFASKTPIK